MTRSRVAPTAFQWGIFPVVLSASVAWSIHLMATGVSEPVAVLLKRARRLVAADFLTIVKDLAPDGVPQVNLVGGITEEEAEFSDY